MNKQSVAPPKHILRVTPSYSGNHSHSRHGEQFFLFIVSFPNVRIKQTVIEAIILWMNW